MKVICAWCDRVIEEGDSDKNGEVSHGICNTCSEWIRAGEKTLQQYIESIDAPVVVVNSKSQIDSYNEKATELLDINSSLKPPPLTGDFMECAYARRPEGCGQALHCKACTIRNTVNETLISGRDMIRIPAILNHDQNGKINQVEFLITTRRYNKIVLLKIEKV